MSVRSKTILLAATAGDLSHILHVSNYIFNFAAYSVHLNVYIFKASALFVLFVPTSRNRMSNIFRDSESLGKSNGKKWSNI